MDAVYPVYLVRIARRFTGVASEYLVETPLPLQEVSTLLGYSDPGNFTHAFKRWAGTSPSAFRLARRSIAKPGSREQR